MNLESCETVSTRSKGNRETRVHYETALSSASRTLKTRSSRHDTKYFTYLAKIDRDSIINNIYNSIDEIGQSFDQLPTRSRQKTDLWPFYGTGTGKRSSQIREPGPGRGQTEL